MEQMIRADISPAIYRLLSNINVAKLGQNTGVPDIPDREAYISELVDTWTGCAAVLIHNDMRVSLLIPAGMHSNPWMLMSTTGLVLLYGRVWQGILAAD